MSEKVKLSPELERLLRNKNNKSRCTHSNNEVVNSRKQVNGVYRRRECLDCGFRWSTREIPIKEYREFSDSLLKIIKRSHKSML